MAPSVQVGGSAALRHRAPFRETAKNRSRRVARLVRFGLRIVRGMAEHWLFKSEPDVFGIDHLERNGRTEWSGVRNFQARNFMREMKVGDLGFFYHSSTKPPGIAGIVRVVREAYPDFTQFEHGHEYEDPSSRPERPKWWMVDVEFVRKFHQLITLEFLRGVPELAAMPLLRRGQRLSVQPVPAQDWVTIVKLADAQAT